MNLEYKLDWQRKKRDAFKAEFGFSLTSFYATGKLRIKVLERDGYACVKCGMTDAEHKQKWGRPITVDHQDKNKKHNTMDNLQTLCLACHGRKDLLPRLRHRKWQEFQPQIIALRGRGFTYQGIADKLGIAPSTAFRCMENTNV